MPTPSSSIGPFRVGDAGHTIFGPPNGNPSPETIATVKPGPRMKANARMLAIGPEACDALRELITAVEEAFAVRNATRGGSMTGTECRAIEKARAVLVKAEGRTQ